ncbi:Crp/Fnr family transcriptional regulator [Oryzibacter oryziterrae]|uniref:Crp/Fnr family transcriptional regulator n=1 Tax=Oryzibacter oryziterrae TaxID=2766474 RepID=UPI001F3B7E67|nr:Crp/Fnr family transcriptional regulator [Oryzibacter oryziterrae]
MDTSDDLDELLRGTELFGELTDDDRNAVAACFRLTRFEAGRTLFQAGDAGDRAYLLADGQVRMTLATAGGRELNVRVARRGDLVGEIAVLDGGERSADAVVLTDALAYVITAADLSGLFETRKGLARSVIALLCRRLRATTAQLEGIALHRIEVRLARYLLDRLDGQTAPAGKRVPLEIGLSQTDMARLIGASRPKLNVALGFLEKEGAIKRTSDRLFCDPEALARIADAFEE